jgi:tRNA pseudouridine55 synthase
VNAGRLSPPAGSPDGGSLEGALVIDKPRGLTSHDVVGALRRALGQPRIGHTGTLDPIATGVLPVLLGRATRLAQFVAGAEKTYLAHVALTGETATDDATGAMVPGTSAGTPARAEIEAALSAFRGSFLQTPPAYSAKKVDGRRAYALARRNVAASLEPVGVTVHELDLIDWAVPIATLRIVCSAGFYVRALARDLGRALGTGGHLTGLRRLASGRFRLEDAVPFDEVLRDPAAGRLRVIPSALVVEHLPAVVLGGSTLERVLHGNDVAVTGLALEPPPAAAHVRLVGPDGTLVGIGAPGARPGFLHPVVVLM